MAEPNKPTLADLYPEMVNKEGKFALPTTAELQKPNRSSAGPGINVSWYEDPAVAAATTALGAGAGAVAGKYVTPATADIKAERTLAGLTGQQDVIQRQLESARAPFSAAQGATEAAQMELARNRMLMEAVTQRAMQLGVDPLEFVKSPELFRKAMSPEAGYAGKNWVKAQYGNVNPILENRLVGTGGAKEMVENFMASAPRAQAAVGPTIQEPSGIIRPTSRGAEGTRAGMMVGNIDKTLQEAIIAREQAQAAQSAMQANVDPRLATEANKLERQIAGQQAEMARAAQMSPSAMDKLAKALSGPWAGAGLGALSAYHLPKAVREAMEGDYKNALLHGMEGLGGAAMAFPHPAVKAAGAAMTAIPLTYEYAPKLWEQAQRLFPATPKK